jgi:hypothetical protein
VLLGLVVQGVGMPAAFIAGAAALAATLPPYLRRPPADDHGLSREGKPGGPQNVGSSAEL